MGRICSAFLLCASLAAAEPALLVRAGRLLDVRTGELRADQGILVRGDRIASVGPWVKVSAEAPQGARRLDLSGRTVLPGLLDAHVHLFLQGNLTGAHYEAQILKESIPYRTLRAAAAARRALEQGFTAVRDLGTEGAGHADTDLKKAIEAGVVPGPRLQVADLAFSATGTYPLQNFAWELSVPTGVQVVDGAEEIRRGVREQVRRGADWIKVYVDRGYWVAEDGRLRSKLNFTLDELKAFVAEARRLGKPTSAHASGWDGLDAALTAGFDTLEHGYGLDEGLMDRAIRQGTWWCPTMYTIVFVNEGRGGAYRRMPEILFRAFRRAVEKGVRIACGSDAGAFPWSEPLWKELDQYAKHGMTRLQALQSATLRAAELMGIEKESGSLEPGKRADLVAVDGNPLEDLSSLGSVVAVVKSGAVVKGGPTN
ncbi:MAG: amidohydrolase family protein [Acidobacteria bacterium]|nr:amidohydrolase family protein [Acidobacteriota bacterium]